MFEYDFYQCVAIHVPSYIHCQAQLTAQQQEMNAGRRVPDQRAERREQHRDNATLQAKTILASMNQPIPVLQVLSVV
jgi:hypothetical protein